ncbi:contact-dependent growth inhibition system immunity protein [Actinomycetospora lemnae]|uniref:Contact-dependent growth inhibition system immunity protein n=1 Tax=Actinomycetospora lemnae TaxID=3019891 RepID=A0ABT5SVT8_9PSEU|nr:contact-dependent growth inhibition system immunity protein [Actinomycetospora sp. DW7H6]MDD7966970.1 contact-dependent growth inhibition system immunity protein [Actinomycetospora sp. DW7H6]
MDIDPQAEEWSELWTLFGAYFHQDFQEEHGTPEETVRAFCRESSPEQRMEAAAEVRRILDGTAGEADTLQVVHRFGLDYAPEAEGWKMRDWLAELERVLRDPHRSTTLNWPHES